MVTEPGQVSVVTACYNAGETIEKTFQSVFAQTYDRIQYIVIDGGSTDSTLQSVDKFRSRLSVIVSEPDEGISDAFNKGIALATGDYVQLLNADDDMPPEKIARSVQLLQQNPDAGFVFGDIILVDGEGVPLLRVDGDPHYEQVVRRSMPRVNHPTFLVRREVYRQCGGFDSRWRIGMDYDWLLRANAAGVKGVHSPDVQVNMQIGGASQEHPVQTMNEERQISVAHGHGSLMATAYFLARVVRLAVRLVLERVLPARTVSLFRPGKTVMDANAPSNLDSGRA